MKLFALIFSFASLSVVFGQAGMKGRLNPTGIDFALNIVEELPIEIPVANHSVQFASFGRINQTIDVKEVNLIGVDFGNDVAVSQLNEGSYRFIGNGSLAEYLGKYSIHYSPQLYPESSGMLHFQYNGSTILDVDLVLENGDVAGVNVVDCEVTIEDSTLMDQSTFEHDANQMALYNVTQGSLKEHISNQLCLNLIPGIAGSLSVVIRAIPPEFPITPAVKVNTSLYSLPIVVGDGSFQAEIDGRSYPTNSPNISYPYTRVTLPDFEKSSVMAQIAISDFSLKTLVHSLVVANAARLEVDLSGVQLGAITFSLEFMQTIVPGIANFLNGRDLLFEVEINEVPSFTLADSLLSIDGEIDLSFVAFNSTNQDRELIATITATLSTSGNVSLVHNRIFAHVSTLEISLEVKASPGLDVNIAFLNFFVQPAAINSIILPSINNLLSNGFELPPVFGYNFYNSDLKIVDRAVFLAFDLVNAGEPTGFDGTEELNNLGNALTNLAGMAPTN